MCGRYTVTMDKESIEFHFNAKFVAKDFFNPTYNAAPSQKLPIIRTYHSHRIELGTWGFWPEEWKHSKRVRPQINARVEMAAEKPMFRDSFATRHCMVITDGYYGWFVDPRSGRKQPYRIMLKSGEPFAMAGIYARNDDRTAFDDAESATVNFAILTTKANDAVSHIHERMPVILPLGREKQWLPAQPSGMIVLAPFPAELMTAYPVTPKMNNARFNEPEAIKPLVPAII